MKVISQQLSFYGRDFDVGRSEEGSHNQDHDQVGNRVPSDDFSDPELTVPQKLQELHKYFFQQVIVVQLFERGIDLVDFERVQSKGLGVHL